MLKKKKMETNFELSHIMLLPGKLNKAVLLFLSLRPKQPDFSVGVCAAYDTLSVLRSLSKQLICFNCLLCEE